MVYVYYIMHMAKIINRLKVQIFCKSGLVNLVAIMLVAKGLSH